MVLATCATGAMTVLRYQGGDVPPASRDVAAFSGRLFRDKFARLPDRQDGAPNTPGRWPCGSPVTPCRAAAPPQGWASGPGSPVRGVITSRRDPA